MWDIGGMTSIFKMSGNKLSLVKEKRINLERDIQKITENNLKLVFGLETVSSEFALQQLRIDTLAFDPETSGFVIIEYKRDKSFSVIDQGYAYLALMLNNKADFILEYNEKTGSQLTRNQVDWSQSRVLFVAQSFTTHQRRAIEFKDLPIELWEVKVFDNDTILYDKLLSAAATESIKTISKDKTIKDVSREVRVYSVDDHVNDKPGDIQELFGDLREKILSLGEEIEERPKKHYISYRTQVAFVYLHLQKSKIKIHVIIGKDKLEDPRNISRDVSSVGHYGGGVTEIPLSKSEELPYVMGLIEQSYQASI